MADSPHEIAYQAALKAIDRQSEALASLRGRAGTLLSAAALVASFLGVPALQSAGGGWGDAFGLAGLIGVLSLTLVILAPYKLVFRLSATVLLEDHVYVENPTPVRDLQAFLARTIDGHHDQNEIKLRRLNFCFQLACVCLGVETVAWLAGI